MIQKIHRNTINSKARDISHISYPLPHPKSPFLIFQSPKLKLKLLRQLARHLSVCFNQA